MIHKIFYEIRRNLEKFRSNVIQLEKGNIFEECNISSKDAIGVISFLGNCANKIKILNMFETDPHQNYFAFEASQSDERYKAKDVLNFEKFTNFEHVGLEWSQIISIDTNVFDSFKNLSYLNLKFRNLEKFAEFFFTGLTKLKDINDECIKSIYLYMYKKHVYNKRE